MCIKINRLQKLALQANDGLVMDMDVNFSSSDAGSRIFHQMMQDQVVHKDKHKNVFQWCEI